MINDPERNSIGGRKEGFQTTNWKVTRTWMQGCSQNFSRNAMTPGCCAVFLAIQRSILSSTCASVRGAPVYLPAIGSKNPASSFLDCVSQNACPTRGRNEPKSNPKIT